MVQHLYFAQVFPVPFTRTCDRVANRVLDLDEHGGGSTYFMSRST
jgi:hypothetical protein